MRTRRRFTEILVVVLLAVSLSAVQAEISVHDDTTIIMAITDGPDPISRVWTPVRRVDLRSVLNALGNFRGDGRPDVAFHPLTGAPTVAWAYNNGSDHDIAVAEWDGKSWEIEFLTSSFEDELDPRVFVDQEGGVQVAWWTNSKPPRVMLASRDANAETWLPERQVSLVNESGRRPSVAALDGQIHVVYERHGIPVDETEPAMLVIRRLTDHGEFEFTQAVVSRRTAPLDPILHVHGSRMWLDWKHSDKQFGRLIHFDDGWAGIKFYPWRTPSWVGVEEVRKSILFDILTTIPRSTNGPTASSTP
jgi:hypothetical protein